MVASTLYHGIAHPASDQLVLPFDERLQASDCLASIAYGQSRFDAAALQNALLAYRALLKEAEGDGEPSRLTKVRSKLGGTLRSLGGRFGGAEGLAYLEESAKVLQTCLDEARAEGHAKRIGLAADALANTLVVNNLTARDQRRSTKLPDREETQVLRDLCA